VITGTVGRTVVLVVLDVVLDPPGGGGGGTTRVVDVVDEPDVVVVDVPDPDVVDVEPPTVVDVVLVVPGLVVAGCVPQLSYAWALPCSSTHADEHGVLGGLVG